MINNAGGGGGNSSGGGDGIGRGRGNTKQHNNDINSNHQSPMKKRSISQTDVSIFIVFIRNLQWQGFCNRC